MKKTLEIRMDNETREYYFLAGQHYALEGLDIKKYIQFLQRPLGLKRDDTHKMWAEIIFTMRGYYYGLGVKLKLGSKAGKYRPGKENKNI